MLVLIHNLTPEIKLQYFTAKKPFKTWNSIINHFGDVVKILGPSVMNEWANMRLQDYPTVVVYVTAIFTLKSKKEQCGFMALVTDTELISKTLTTFPADAAN